jgi:serine/threonine protein kinase
MADANTQRSTGQLLSGRYRLTDVVRHADGQTAWQAEDTELARLVTVTELRADKRHSEPTERRRLVARMLREAEVMALVCPDRVLTCLDIVEEDDRLWTVTEVVNATPLDEILAVEGTLDAVRAARIGMELLAVLTAAHGEGITHGDVRPSYVLVRPDGHVVLGGFGVTADLIAEEY